MASSIRIEDSARGKREREREKKEISPGGGREERERERRIYVFPVYKHNIYANNYGRNSQRRMQKCPRFSSRKETALVKSEQFSRELKIFNQRKNTFFYRIFEIHFKSFEFL